MSEKWEIEKGYPLCCRAVINLCPLRVEAESPISWHLNHYLSLTVICLFVCMWKVQFAITVYNIILVPLSCIQDKKSGLY